MMDESLWERIYFDSISKSFRYIANDWKIEIPYHDMPAKVALQVLFLRHGVLLRRPSIRRKKR